MSTQSKNNPCGTVRVLTLVSLISAAFGASAQSALTQDEKWLAPVVVTASRIEQQQADALPHITVITAEEIRNSQAVDLPSLLRREAGIQITQSGGVGAATGLFLRGAETRQTLVLVDGVPMNLQDASGSVSIQNLMLANIERIEVVRGNVSAIYGSGAVGGVIQIFTRTGKGPARFNASVEGGSRETGKLVAGVSGATDNFNYALTASRFKTEGFSAQNPRQTTTADPDKDGYDNTAFSGQLGYQLAKGHEIGIRFLNSEGDLEYDGGFDGSANSSSTTRTASYTLYSRNKVTDIWGSELSVSRLTDKSSDFTNGNRNSSANTKTVQTLWSNSVALAADWTGTVGFEYRDESVDTTSQASPSSAYDRSRNVQAAFAGLVGELDKHSLQANLRYDDYSDIGSADTGYMSYGYEFIPGYKAFVSYSTSFAAAPLGYLYLPGFGNPDLKPEEIRTKEVGFQYAKGASLLKVVGFQSRITNQIQFGTSQFENVQKVRNEGLELSLQTSIAGIDLRSSLTLQDPVDESTQQTLLRRAKKMASLGLSKTFGAYTLGTDWQYTGKRRDNDFSTFPATPRQLSSYIVGNLTARYAVTKQATLFGRIENVTDKEYQTAYGYNQAPRGVFVGLSWQQ